MDRDDDRHAARRHVPAERGTSLSRRALLSGGLATTAAVVLAGCAADDEPMVRSSTTGAGADGTSTTGAPATTESSTSTSVSDDDGYVPPASGTWETVEPDAVGWSADGLAQLAADVGEANTKTFMVVVGGRILAEHYFGGADEATLQDIASCQKSFVSTMIGMARAEGLLDLDDPITEHIGPGWSKAQPAEEAVITIRHAMTMTSGLGEEALRVKDDPGTTFDYNTPVYQKLRRVLEAATEMSIDDLTRSSILDPIGCSATGRWVLRSTPPDPVGDQEWGLRLTARDMARFGVLALRSGRWGDEQLVPDGWFEEAWTSSPAQVDYGLLWWLLGKRRRAGQPAPGDWVAALGAGDQKIYVVPSLDLVVTRQGDAAAEASEHSSSFDDVLLSGLVRAHG